MVGNSQRKGQGTRKLITCCMSIVGQWICRLLVRSGVRFCRVGEEGRQDFMTLKILCSPATYVFSQCIK